MQRRPSAWPAIGEKVGEGAGRGQLDGAHAESRYDGMTGILRVGLKSNGEFSSSLGRGADSGARDERGSEES